MLKLDMSIYFHDVMKINAHIQFEHFFGSVKYESRYPSFVSVLDVQASDYPSRSLSLRLAPCLCWTINVDLWKNNLSAEVLVTVISRDSLAPVDRQTVDEWVIVHPCLDSQQLRGNVCIDSSKVSQVDGIQRKRSGVDQNKVY
jgi:hypothetical protein